MQLGSPLGFVTFEAFALQALCRSRNRTIKTKEKVSSIRYDFICSPSKPKSPPLLQQKIQGGKNYPKMSTELSTPVVRVPSNPDATFFFTSHPSVQAFKVSPKDFLARHFDKSNKTRPPVPTFLATGAIVFDRPALTADGSHPISNHASSPRVLLIQRAPDDSMPLKWETPGGGCDDEDPSILYACARELKEEAGLLPVSVGPVVPCRATATASNNGAPEDGQPDWGERMGGQYFFTRRGNLVCKFNFL